MKVGEIRIFPLYGQAGSVMTQHGVLCPKISGNGSVIFDDNALKTGRIRRTKL